MTKIIEDQKSHLINFRPGLSSGAQGVEGPGISLEGISIALEMRESGYEKLEQLLGTSCNLISENLHLEGSDEEEEGPEVKQFEELLD